MGDDLRIRASRGTWFLLSSSSAPCSPACLPLLLLSDLGCRVRPLDSSDGVLLGALRESAVMTPKHLQMI